MGISVITRILIAAAILALLPQTGDARKQPLRNVDHFFELVNVDRAGDDYRLTIANNSNRGFSDFVIVVEGVDISRITVYREEIEVRDLMEGQSERTFLLPDVDERVFKIDIQVFDRAPVAY